MLAFKYRVHDSQLGRFLSIDPLAPDYPWNSPYAFSENRVIDGVELEGLERFSINSPAWVERLEKVQTMPVTTNSEIEAKMRAFRHWATGLQAASADNPGLVTISNYVNDRGGVNDAIVFSPVMSNREIAHFDKKLPEPQSDASRNYEGSFDGALQGEIYSDHIGISVAVNYIPVMGGSFALNFGWVKGDGFALTGTVGGGGGWDWDLASAGPSVGISVNFSKYDDVKDAATGQYKDPNWGDMMGPSGQLSGSYGGVGFSFSQGLKTDENGNVTGLSPWRTVGIGATLIGGKDPSGSVQTTYTFPIK